MKLFIVNKYVSACLACVVAKDVSFSMAEMCIGQKVVSSCLKYLLVKKVFSSIDVLLKSFRSSCLGKKKNKKQKIVGI
jgi:hypothetical protein